MVVVWLGWFVMMIQPWTMKSNAMTSNLSVTAQLIRKNGQILNLVPVLIAVL